MPKRPVSGKQHKAELQLKRAIKRGEVPPPEHKPTQKRRTKDVKSTPGRSARQQLSSGTVESAQKLQSSFHKLSPAFLDKTKHLAATLPLPRPLTRIRLQPFVGSDKAAALTCPKRPKWRFDMSKNEVEKNEEGLFKKWIAHTDSIVSSWVEDGVVNEHDSGVALEAEAEPTTMPRSTTYFERNIEVWRQLYVESSLFRCSRLTFRRSAGV